MNKSESGQALLLVLLGMSVILVVAMSTISQSISDITVTTKEEEALRAFSAAEAGVEQSLINDLSVGETLPPVVVSDQGTPQEVTYTAEADYFPDGQYYVYPDELVSGETATIWFKPHTSSGYLDTSATGFNGNNIYLYWGENTTDTALEVSLWYLEGGIGPLTVQRIILDPGRDPGSTETVSGVDVIGAPTGTYNLTYEGRIYRFKQRYTVRLNASGPFGLSNAEKNNMYLVKLRTLLNDLPESVGTRVSGGSLPPQGKKIESTGSSGESLRKIKVFELYPDVPGIFDSAITTNASITK